MTNNPWKILHIVCGFDVPVCAPLRGQRVLISVCSYNDVHQFPHNWKNVAVRPLAAINVDLRDRAHLLHLANISGRHDGRNVGLLVAAIEAKYYDALQIPRILQHLCLNSYHDDFLGIVIKCRHGRHRSVASAVLLSSVLRYCGASVTIVANSGIQEWENRYRFCRLQCCCGGNYRLTRRDLDPVFDQTENEFLELLRTVPQNSRDEGFYRCTDLFEYMDFNYD